jgi:membrane-bound serine protease (ClpP class)
MVTTATSYDDTTAIQKHLVDLGAVNLNDLLNKVQGKAVTLDSGRVVTLQTANASVQMINASTVDTLYSFLIDPNVVFLLFIVAMIGIYLEISHPGVILPGVAGAIALLLFLFAAGSLSPNWAGLGLMILAFVFLILDVRLPTHGALTIGAVVSLIVGSLLFFNSGGPYSGSQVNPIVVYTMSGVIGLIGLTLVTFIVRARHTAAPSGVATMIGAKATAITPLLPEGRVNYEGENWAAILVPPATSLDAGSEVQIVAVEGLRLFVQPIRPLVHSDIYSVSPSE